jgi:hypothetical protein
MNTPRIVYGRFPRERRLPGHRGDGRNPGKYRCFLIVQLRPLLYQDFAQYHPLITGEPVEYNECYLLRARCIQLTGKIPREMVQHCRLSRRKVVQSTVALLYPRQESYINVLPHLLESLE